ncbi:MAG: linear amide C-N hydrolase [Firmicutes bacterium]|nr:linear amide C-N hydrolase [Bacillota bacterium]
MCTAISYRSGDLYFGRNLDLEYSYDERVTITPRNFPLKFRHVPAPAKGYAMIGMAFVQDGCPLYYEATNEKGLSMAGLNFPGNADYKPYAEGFDNVAPFEFIPWVLSQCETVGQAKVLLSRINLIKEDFSGSLPATPLHWMISGSDGSIVVESVKEGLKIYDNKVGVLTNNPPFDIQLWNLESSKFLPGDLSSESRFLRAEFTLRNALGAMDGKDSEACRVSQFFHILGNVAMVKGCRPVNGKYMHTIYSCCCNASRGIFYYTTYDNSRITAVDMHRENLDGDSLTSYGLVSGPQFLEQN